jgi:Zn-dependent protease/CBS domain-containing protein
MFGRAFKILELFGFPIKIDPSWFIVLLLVAWSLATGWFPMTTPGRTAAVYWTMGTLGAVGLFVSILLHELSHSVVARRFGLAIRGITLFLFGGVAEMTEEPANPRTEFWMAIAGPIMSVAIAVVCWGAANLGAWVGWSDPAVAVLSYLGVINGILVLFNMLPAFPLDGGRVMRSVLWARWKDLRRATRVSSSVGAFFGMAFIVFGVFSLVGGNVIGGIWLGLIGFFLRNAAQSSYSQVVLRRLLGGEPVWRFAEPDVHTVPPDLTVRELVEDHVYRYHHKMFPVMDRGVLMGSVATRDIRKVGADLWDSSRVRDIMEPLSEATVIAPDADALDALSRMRTSSQSRLMVVTPDGRLVGILALKDLLEYFQLKVELEEG